MGDKIDRIKLTNQVSKNVGMAAVDEYCDHILTVMKTYEFTLTDLRMLQERFATIAALIEATIKGVQDELGGNGGL